MIGAGPMAAPLPLLPFVSTLCPTCAEKGRAFKVTTIQGRKALNVTLLCAVCRREWTVEQEDDPPPPQ